MGRSKILTLNNPMLNTAMVGKAMVKKFMTADAWALSETELIAMADALG